MFIIARRRGQRIDIGDDIAITITEISRNSVKLGIDAPRTCLIARGELKESVALANQEAARSHLLANGAGMLGEQGTPTLSAHGVTTAETFMLASVKSLASLDVNQSTEQSVTSKER